MGKNLFENRYNIRVLNWHIIRHKFYAIYMRRKALPMNIWKHDVKSLRKYAMRGIRVVFPPDKGQI